MLLSRTVRAWRFAQLRRFSSLSISGDSLKVPGIENPFPLSWLRDSCQCHACIHPSTKQKLRESSSIVPETRPAQNEGSISLSSSGNELTIQWDTRFEQNHEPHTSTYSLEFLKRYSSPQNLQTFHHDVDFVKWTREEISQSSHLYLSYDDIKNPSGLLQAMHQLVHYGLVFIRGVPSQEISDANCELPTLASIFGEIRETLYGRIWDVKNVKNSKNIAYTNLNLDLHMDLQYFKHPPQYQILHCLRNRVHGGTSIFVDAFKVAEQLYESSKPDYELLCSTPVDFHYINDGHHLHYSHPIIELAPLYQTYSKLNGITPRIDNMNYSPPFQAPLPLSTPVSFYTALARFTELLRRPSNRFEYTLKEGDAVIFNNRRVLHARTAFREWQDGERPKGVEKAQEGDINRLLKGCYLEADAILDRMRVLASRLQD